jgi:hypothetical protein
MPEDKKYDIPKEIINIILEADNYLDLRDVYSKLPFGFKKAKKCGLLAKQKKNEFWCKVIELYPELYGNNLMVDYCGSVTITK